MLGHQLNTTPGAVEGRREINWDGVPEELLNQKLPEDFFNPTSPQAPVANQRGLSLFSRRKFPGKQNQFRGSECRCRDQLSSFSGNKIFANISSQLWDVEFQVPGKQNWRSVKGFGIVFSDVDLPKSYFT